MQQYGTKYFACRPPPLTFGMGSIGHNLTFLEKDYIKYQIKGNHDGTNMVSNILPADPHTPYPGDEVNKSKCNYLSTVMLHIKINGIMK